MRRLFIVLVFFSIFFQACTRGVRASLVVVKNDGQTFINVLASEDSRSLSVPKREALEVKESVAGESGRISLTNADGKISMAVVTSDGERELDVTDYKSDLIEIEERPKSQKVIIKTDGLRFYLVQEGVEAFTELPLNVDPRTAELSAVTESGIKYISILPSEAVGSLLKAKVISKANTGGVSVSEEDGVLSYRVEGEKLLNLFNVYRYPVPVTAIVSASTGEILKTSEPIWLKILSFMFA